jgi:hypothetical protein
MSHLDGQSLKWPVSEATGKRLPRSSVESQPSSTPSRQKTGLIASIFDPQQHVSQYLGDHARDGLKGQTAPDENAGRYRQTRGKRTPENWAQIQQTCLSRPMLPQTTNCFARSQHWSVMGAVLQNGLPTAPAADRSGF